MEAGSVQLQRNQASKLSHQPDRFVDPRGHYSNPPSPGEMANQSGVRWPDLINPRVREAISELYDHVFGESETAQRSGAIGSRLTARDRSNAGSHPRKSRSSSLPTWPERRHSSWPASTRFTGPPSWPFSNATRWPDEGGC